MSAAIARPRPRRRGPPGAAREIGDRRRQARALVAHLDAHPVASARAPAARPAPAVLDRVGEEVAARLGEAQPVAAHEYAAPPARPSRSAAPAPARRGAPGRHGGADQRADVDRLGTVAPRGRPRARPRGPRAPGRRAAARGRSRRAPRGRAGGARSAAPRRAACSGPRSSWQARATSSARRGAARASSAAAASAAAASDPRPRPRRPSARAHRLARPARRRGGSRRPTR